MDDNADRTSLRLAIVADDLTGAADAAAPFAAHGVAAAVALRAGVDPGTTVVAVSTESRDLPEDKAVAAVRAAADWMADATTPRWWYKKVDSMWRGWPEAEASALAEATGTARVVLAPALPARDRAVRGGVVCVGDRAVAAPRTSTNGAVGRLSLATVRGGQRGLTAAIARLPVGITVADGEDDDDVRAVAEAAIAAGGVLLGGSAGLTAALAAVLTLPRIGRRPPPAAMPTLAVVASMHPAAVQQVATAEANGTATVVRAPADASLADPGCAARLAAEVAPVLRKGGSVVLTTAGEPSTSLPGRVLARQLATMAAHPDVRPLIGSFYMSGGDAAAACLDALGADALLLGGEVEPGIPWGLIGGGAVAGTPVVTKAGSFGDPGTLARCLGFLAGASSGRH